MLLTEATTAYPIANGEVEHSHPLNRLPCFYCGHTIDQRAARIQWDGYMGKGMKSLQMHPTCAVALAMQLARDAHEYGGAAHSWRRGCAT
jgi:hypothetical protein